MCLKGSIQLSANKHFLSPVVEDCFYFPLCYLNIYSAFWNGQNQLEEGKYCPRNEEYKKLVMGTRAGMVR